MVVNAIGMGAGVIFVLLGSNILVSLLKDFIPEKVRIPSYIVIIASFVTIVDLVMQAYAPALSRNLGVFVPLIVVNCIILGRAEVFANKNGIGRSVLDALGMGVGFTLGLIADRPDPGGPRCRHDNPVPLREFQRRDQDTRPLGRPRADSRAGGRGAPGDRVSEGILQLA